MDIASDAIESAGDAYPMWFINAAKYYRESNDFVNASGFSVDIDKLNTILLKTNNILVELRAYAYSLLRSYRDKHKLKYKNVSHLKAIPDIVSLEQELLGLDRYFTEYQTLEYTDDTTITKLTRYKDILIKLISAQTELDKQRKLEKRSILYNLLYVGVGALIFPTIKLVVYLISKI